MSPPMTRREERYVCTAVAPWTPEKGPTAAHPDVVEVYCDDYSDGTSIATYKCPHCGMRFRVELPR